MFVCILLGYVFVYLYFLKYRVHNIIINYLTINKEN